MNQMDLFTGFLNCSVDVLSNQTDVCTAELCAQIGIGNDLGAVDVDACVCRSREREVRTIIVDIVRVVCTEEQRTTDRTTGNRQIAVGVQNDRTAAND